MIDTYEDLRDWWLEATCNEGYDGAFREYMKGYYNFNDAPEDLEAEELYEYLKARI